MNNTANNSNSGISHTVSRPKSTGQNALVHGVYASDIILAWESAEDFEQLHQELRTEWAPEGRMEEETVVTLARWNWLKHRVMRSTQMAFRKDPFVAALEQSGAKSWEDVVSYLQKKAIADDGVMDEAKKTLQVLKTATQNAADAMTAANPDTSAIYIDVKSLTKIFEKHVLPVYGKAFEKGTSNKTVEEAYLPDYLEKIVRLEASIDARIDKTLQRLVNLKEYKRLVKTTESSKQIPSPSIAPTNVETATRHELVQ